MKKPSHGAIEHQDSRWRPLLRRMALLIFAGVAVSVASSCGSQPPPDDVTAQECEWGVGCTPQCTIKYGRSPYCDRD